MLPSFAPDSVTLQIPSWSMVNIPEAMVQIYLDNEAWLQAVFKFRNVKQIAVKVPV